MKLFTHNMLISPNTKNGYPLKIEATRLDTDTDAEFEPTFTARMVPKLEYAPLLAAVNSLNVEHSLPPEVPHDYEGDEAFLRALHHVILEIDVLEGTLVCPETGKRFPIKEGIPSML